MFVSKLRLTTKKNLANLISVFKFFFPRFFTFEKQVKVNVIN